MSENEEQNLDVNNQDSEYNEKFLKRFWAKVQKCEGCWDWVGAIQSKGYGSISVKGQTQSAHRVSYLLFVGEIPAGMCVLHRCDNRKCVNPAHLFLGNNQDNINDKVNKGRQSRNRVNRQTKLNFEKAILLRELYKQGNCSYKILAHQFGISKSSVGATIRSEYWNVPDMM